MKGWLKDVRYGLRVFANNPGFALVILSTLALGIGANTAIFSVVNAVLLRPLPYPAAERLVMVWEKKDADLHNVVSPANFLAWKDESEVFEHLAAFLTTRASVTGAGEPEEVTTQYVTEDFFPTLGTPPLIGRTFTAKDCTPESAAVVVLRHGYWQRRFSGDPDIVGKSFTMNGRPAEIIGVMPAGFSFQMRENAGASGQPEMWGAMGFRAADRTPKGRYLSSIARLKPGIDITRAKAAMDAIAARLGERFPDFDTGWGISLVPLREQLVGPARPVLLLLFATVGLVLLIACANVANMLLARAAARRKEIAIRAALGAGRARIVRQLVTEAIVLAAAGGTVGLLLAVWGADLLLALAPPELLGLQSVSADWRVLGFTLGASLVTGLLFGVTPSIHATKIDVSEAMEGGGSRGVTESRTRRLRETFVVSQVALSLVLLVGSGLLVRSLLRLQAVDPGFDRGQLLTFQLTLPRARYAELDKRIRFFTTLVERIEAIPGVRSASMSSALPFAGMGGSNTNFAIEGRPPQPPGQDLGTDVRMIDPGYFETMSIPLLEGRTFTAREAEQATGVVIVTQAMARLHWPNESPLGKRIVINMKDENTPSEIVGVVGDVRGVGLDVEPREMSYWPHAELPSRLMSIVVRAEGEPLSLVPGVRRIVRDLDPELPIAEVHTMDQLIATSIARARFSSVLLSLFAVVAGLIACVGLYGVMSQLVAQRGREIGIRMALGATPVDVMRMVLSRGIAIAAIGIVAGLVVAVALTRTLASFLHGTSPTDPVTFASIAALLSAVAFGACYGPARRAARLDPVDMLRRE
jgi:putative ABC transport system permease protein